MNCDVTEVVSSPPPAERTPEVPAGTATVTFVDGSNGVLGVKISESPSALQLPGTLGVIVGFGVLADMAPEKVTTIGSAPSIAVARLAGVIAVMRIGPAARAPVPCPDRAWPGWAGDDCVTANTTPAVIAAAAAVPSAMSFTLGLRELLAEPIGSSAPEPGGWLPVLAGGAAASATAAGAPAGLLPFGSVPSEAVPSGAGLLAGVPSGPVPPGAVLAGASASVAPPLGALTFPLLPFGLEPFGLEPTVSLAWDRSSSGCCAGRFTPNTPNPRSWRHWSQHAHQSPAAAWSV